MNKNAYEIRLELLQLAHADVMTKYHETMNNQKETIYNNGQEVKDLSKLDVTLPEVSQIINRAKELYEFVNG
jgi:hypothetical protein